MGSNARSSGSFVEKLDEASKTLKDKLGVTLKELLTLPQGPASLAVVGKAEGKIPVAVLIQADRVGWGIDQALRVRQRMAEELSVEDRVNEQARQILT